jgi:hypothetical protein
MKRRKKQSQRRNRKNLTKYAPKTLRDYRNLAVTQRYLVASNLIPGVFEEE